MAVLSIANGCMLVCRANAAGITPFALHHDGCCAAAILCLLVMSQVMSKHSLHVEHCCSHVSYVRYE